MNIGFPDGRQRGLSLVMALFILVVLAMLGAVMIKLLSSGNESVAREVISTRALLAAESGAQIKLNEIFVASGSVDENACAPSPGVSDEQDYSLGGLFGCADDVSVVCNYVTVDSVNYYTITSTGSCGPSDSPAVRVVQVQAKDDI